MKYPGTELELFAEATHWKRYFATKLRPFVTGRVLDVGCGMGVNANFLVGPTVSNYTFLEPDVQLLSRVPDHIDAPLMAISELVNGTVHGLEGRQFDTILYVDVIEHIEHASAELDRAFTLLAPGGYLMILVPAYQFLYTNFDAELGHVKRYDKAQLVSELPRGGERVALHYLDSMGLLLSLGNKLLLHQARPTLSQIKFWDRIVIPISKIMDKVLMHKAGRSLIAVVRKPPVPLQH